MKTRNDKSTEKPVSQAQHITKSAAVGLQAGCLTFIAAAAAIGVGLLLDTRMDTFPLWTLILLVGSAPFTLGGVYWLVRRALRRVSVQGENTDDNDNTK